MKSEKEGLALELASLVGEANVSDNIYERISYAQDALSPDLEPEKIPLVVVKPVSARDISRVVKYANQEKIPIYIHGAGTAFKGAPRPKRPGSILLSLQGLTSVEINEEDLYFEAGAGANQYELEKMLQARGYMLPMNVKIMIKYGRRPPSSSASFSLAEARFCSSTSTVSITDTSRSSPSNRSFLSTPSNSSSSATVCRAIRTSRGTGT